MTLCNLSPENVGCYFEKELTEQNLYLASTEHIIEHSVRFDFDPDYIPHHVEECAIVTWLLGVRLEIKEESTR